MNITQTSNSVFWVYQGQPCIHESERITKAMDMETFSAVAILDNECLFVYNYNGYLRFIIRSEGPVAFSVKDFFENGHILCHYPNLPGNYYVCVIDWQTGTMQMKVRYQQ